MGTAMKFGLFSYPRMSFRSTKEIWEHGAPGPCWIKL